LPNTLVNNGYPVFNLSDPSTQKGLGRTLPHKGYFFPEPKDVDFSSQHEEFFDK